MGLRRYVKKNEGETFLIVFIVMAGLAAYLGPWGEKPAGTATPLPTPVASDGGMEKLWLEASLAKGDMRPIPDEVRFEEEAAPEPPALLAPPPAVAEEPPPAEPARSFPEPLPVAEAPQRQRLSPMRESLLEASRSASSSGAFLAFPKSSKETSVPAAAAQAASPAAAAPAVAPRRRQWRPLSGN